MDASSQRFSIFNIFELEILVTTVELQVHMYLEMVYW